MKKPKKRFKLVVKSKKAKAPKPKPAPKPPNDTEDMKIDIVDDGKIDIVGSAPVSQEEPVKKKGPRRIKFKSRIFCEHFLTWASVLKVALKRPENAQFLIFVNNINNG